MFSLYLQGFGALKIFFFNIQNTVSRRRSKPLPYVCGLCVYERDVGFCMWRGFFFFFFALVCATSNLSQFKLFPVRTVCHPVVKRCFFLCSRMGHFFSLYVRKWETFRSNKSQVCKVSSMSRLPEDTETGRPRKTIRLYINNLRTAKMFSQASQSSVPLRTAVRAVTDIHASELERCSARTCTLHVHLEALQLITSCGSRVAC